MNFSRSIQKPTLLIDKRKTQDNIASMVEKAHKNQVVFRPHFKTHQSAEIGQWFREFGVDRITVSSIDMANYFARNGWTDITVAISFNIRQIELANELAATINLNLLVESKPVVNFLSENLKFGVDIWLKIDVGYHRTGVPWEDSARILELAKEIESAKYLRLAGILTHAGHSYHAHSRAEITNVFFDTADKLRSIQSMLATYNINVPISVGDTPGCSVVEEFEGIQEIRPGNFVFYDLAQMRLGTCSEDEISVAVVCPVIAKHQSRYELVIYGGAVHLSKESLTHIDGQSIYGRVCRLNEFGWSRSFANSYLSSISQEHGVIQASSELFDEINVGDLIVLLPVHSCLTANLLGQYLTLEGEKISMFRYTSG